MNALSGEMWFGYIGQLEIVNGGLGVGGRIGAPRATLRAMPAYRFPAGFLG